MHIRERPRLAILSQSRQPHSVKGALLRLPTHRKVLTQSRIKPSLSTMLKTTLLCRSINSHPVVFSRVSPLGVS
jgi:hypothetical protein